MHNYPYFGSTSLRRLCWWLGSVMFGAGSVAMLIFLLVGVSPAARAQSDNIANIIVQFDDQARTVRTIAFTRPLSGLAALQLSGLQVVTTETSFGTAVCSIQGVGCPAENCFCDANRFWAYSYWDGSAWQSYPVGADSSLITQTGAIEGWRWGEFGAAQSPPTQTLAAAAALTWLHARQNITEGGYGSVGASVETMLAIGANQLDASDWRQGPANPSLADFVRLNGAAYTRATAAGAGKLAVATTASAACFPAAGIGSLAHYSPTLGTFSLQSGPNSWAILGAIAFNESVPVSAVTHLRGQLQPSGGWEWAAGWGADTNSTALALQALIAVGEPITSSTVISALAFFESTQNADGGFRYDLTPGTPSDANSTGYVVQALIAAGEDPLGPRWTVSATRPISYLLALQLPDGSFEWQPGTGANQLATQQVIPALLGRAHPALSASLQTCLALYLPQVAKP